MPVTKLNISLDSEIAEMLRKRAAALNKPASRYLADLIAADARRSQDALAEEGYRLLSGDTATFAEAAWPLAAETWPEWESEATQEPEKQSKVRRSRSGHKAEAG